MKRTIIIFPNQLFEEVFDLEGEIVLVEDPLFFGDLTYPLSFNKKKLVLHFASMEAFKSALEAKGRTVHVLRYRSGHEPDYFTHAPTGGEVCFYDPVDDALISRIKKQGERFSGKIRYLESPNFITTMREINRYFTDDESFHMRDFYVHQRRRLNILMDKGKPVGGKYSFDTANRKKLPKDITIPSLLKPERNAHLEAAKNRVEKDFSDNPGTLGGFDYPFTHKQARKHVEDFVDQRLNRFGPYQDALDTDQSVLFHSRLSCALNIGLLSPRWLVDRIERADVPIESKEGFIRQIIGWREFIRASYVKQGRRMRTSNALKHNRTMPAWFLNGTSGMLPLDTVLRRVEKTAYSHHIERLMVIGNIALLARIHPDEVYRYFMASHIDAYDWVMVPNVYGMSQFAAGDALVTKPYFSGANYIRKMGNYPPGQWEDIWNALFYLFLRDNRGIIEKNPRLKMLLAHLDKKDEDTMRHYERLARPILE